MYWLFLIQKANCIYQNYVKFQSKNIKISFFKNNIDVLIISLKYPNMLCSHLSHNSSTCYFLHFTCSRKLWRDMGSNNRSCFNFSSGFSQLPYTVCVEHFYKKWIEPDQHQPDRLPGTLGAVSVLSIRNCGSVIRCVRYLQVMFGGRKL